MPRTKGLIDMAPEAWQLGVMHLPQVDRLPERFIVDDAQMPYDETATAYQQEALLHGKPVTSEVFDEVLSRVTSQEVYPDKIIDASRSAHQVSFGRLIGMRRGKHTRGTVMSVAFKPFDDPAKALQEFNGYRILQDAGIQTFEPVGVFLSEGRTHFIVVTRKRDDLMSLDRDDWVVGRQPHNEAEIEITERNTQTVKDIATTMAHLHANRIFHPDGQVKNFAITVNGRVGVIDTENLHRTETDSDMLHELVWRDIEKLVRSLIIIGSDDREDDKIFGVGMLGRTQLPTLRTACEELIFTPYLQQLERAMEANPEDEDSLTYIGISISERFKNETQWPAYLVSDTN